VAVALAVVIGLMRGGLRGEAPLEELARRSPDLHPALANGRPTLVEFYADWCEACRAMAPALRTVESRHRDRMDVVLLNVDNPRWQPELDRYDVNGIPHLEFFNEGGTSVGRSLGVRSEQELDRLASAVIAGRELPAMAGVGQVSRLGDADAAPMRPGTAGGGSPGPRSHG
jgi:thiol-disulfide isomerase/thioredoxin